MSWPRVALGASRERLYRAVLGHAPGDSVVRVRCETVSNQRLVEARLSRPDASLSLPSHRARLVGRSLAARTSYPLHAMEHIRLSAYIRVHLRSSASPYLTISLDITCRSSTSNAASAPCRASHAARPAARATRRSTTATRDWREPEFRSGAPACESNSPRLGIVRRLLPQHSGIAGEDRARGVLALAE